MCAVVTVIFGVCNSVRLSHLFVVTFCKYRAIGLVLDFIRRLVCGRHKAMDKVQNKPNSSVQHKPSSESFQVYPRSVSVQ
jgi:hypothetical protein